MTWPTTAEQVRAFIGPHCASVERAECPENDVYTLTAHDLLSAFEDWADATPVAQPLTDQCIDRIWRMACVSGSTMQDRTRVFARAIAAKLAAGTAWDCISEGEAA